MSLLSVRSLRKAFAETPVIADVSFEVGEGQAFALVGPSGCGKTTTLRLIAGFERPDAGHVRLRGQDITALPPEQRGVGFVFQDYALFPHLTVEANVAFGLRRLPRRPRQERVLEVLSLVGLAGLWSRHPHELSGGQMQRVALARALAPQPHVVLLDEPFNSLDAGLRETTRQDVRTLLHRAGTTSVLVTHDQEEALGFADVLGVMQGGRLEQIGTPSEVYARPRTAFVAQFLGRANVLAGRAEGTSAITAVGTVQLDGQAWGEVQLALRPESLELVRGGDWTLSGREYRGHHLILRLHRDEQRLTVRAEAPCPFVEGDLVRPVPRGRAVPLEDGCDGTPNRCSPTMPSPQAHDPARSMAGSGAPTRCGRR